jgi:hypothetical protein
MATLNMRKSEDNINGSATNDVSHQVGRVQLFGSAIRSAMEWRMLAGPPIFTIPHMMFCFILFVQLIEMKPDSRTNVEAAGVHCNQC